jgi:hypothetical protein
MSKTTLIASRLATLLVGIGFSHLVPTSKNQRSGEGEGPVNQAATTAAGIGGKKKKNANSMITISLEQSGYEAGL